MGSRSAIKPPSRDLHALTRHHQRRHVRWPKAGKLPIPTQIKNGMNEDLTAMNVGIDLCIDYGLIRGQSHGVGRGGMTVEMFVAPRVPETLGLSLFC
ncbi:Protein Shroom3 [Gossypium arboreum]|uniref:Protein Shroom3 n=1 Tax=Gossypium arboreum TaxID=29729 RepID=A0A0B0MWQ5_GOSAR|nr:Protein Shroom3 [Gossypium arboreum]